VNWRPLSLRGRADARFDEPIEGLPAWLRGPVLKWVENSFVRGGRDFEDNYVQTDVLEALQLAFRLEEPFHGSGEWGLLRDLLNRMQDDEFALDVLDWMLHHDHHFGGSGYLEQWAEDLNDVLRQGGSVWEVTAHAGSYQLTRRAAGPVVDVLEHTAAEATRAHDHLSAAWSKLTGRDPDPSGAYREAVRAVEAVAKPVILPDNDRATLGQMIAALRDNPEKWMTTIGTVDAIRAQMEVAWKGQRDRHGTDDETIPASVSPMEADSAFSACLNLVRQFVGGHVSKVQ
jgi:hypothetical protein